MQGRAAVVGVRRLLVAVALGSSPFAASSGQELALASRGPRFIEVSSSTSAPREVDARSSAVLRQVVSLNYERATVGVVLAAIERQTGLRFMYSRALLPADRPVGLRADSITVAGALMELLVDTGMDVLLSSGRQVALVDRGVREKVTPARQGRIVGRVTDAKTGGGIAAATVVVEGTALRATTGDSGQFRIGGVEPGEYTVSARRIGYGRASQRVTVVAEQEVTMEFRLEPAPTLLDQVVVTTPGGLQTEVRALPVPVTVITAADIAQQPVPRLATILRQAVPGAVALDLGVFPQQTSVSVRGAASLAGATGGGTLKVYLDGIEIANRTFATLDPNSIERIEVTRGPQAAAIYGSDAIGGVMQIFTKRGNSLLTRPQVDTRIALGVVQSPYENRSAGRQDYSVSALGGTELVSYNFGAGYAQTGDWLPDYVLSTPSAYGGMKYTHGKLTLNLTGRNYAQRLNRPRDPRAVASGFALFSKPFYRTLRSAQETYGVSAGYATSDRWHHSMTAGIDRFSLDERSTQPRLTTPTDTLLALVELDDRKAFIAYNTTLTVPLATATSAVLTAGFDHYTLLNEVYFTSGATATSGTITTAPGSPVQVTRTITDNTGYFAQAQIGLRDVLFLTGAVRAERNTNFGAGFGTPLSPRGGVAYTWDLVGATIKLRGSYGSAINPPNPRQRFARSDASQIVRANPDLGPERQAGVDGGVDVIFGARGSVGVTAYRQTASGLIQYTLVDAAGRPPEYQFQNVGRVRNRGLEVEGVLDVAHSRLGIQYGYTRSEVRALAPNYTGNLRVGDQVLLIPRHTATASATLTPLPRLRVTASANYVGERMQTDVLAQYRCFAQTGPCHQSARDYLTTYPAFTNPSLFLDYEITPTAMAFIAVENIGNKVFDQLNNTEPSLGRMTMMGVRMKGLL